MNNLQLGDQVIAIRSTGVYREEIGKVLSFKRYNRCDSSLFYCIQDVGMACHHTENFVPLSSYKTPRGNKRIIT